MPPRPERSRLRLLAGGLLLALVVLAIIPGYLTLAPAWRPPAVRAACAVVVVLGCARVTGRVRRSVGRDAPSALDAAPSGPAVPALDERFVRLRDDLVFSPRSQSYFDQILWPRLLRLGGRELDRPAERRGLRRGPSLSALGRVLADIERRT